MSALRRRCAAALLVLVMLQAAAIAREGEAPAEAARTVLGSAGALPSRSIGDLAERLLDDARDGQLDTFDLLTAALIAGGVDNTCELDGWLDRYFHHRQQLLQSLRTSEPTGPFKSIHEALHEQLLTGRYDATASDLRLTIAKGDFNCLSSLAIYLDLCHACELPVQVWLARGHVFLRAAEETGPMDIEPGTPQWDSRAMIRRTGLRELTLVELLGKFFYNRGVERLKEQQFAEGIELLRISLDLDPRDSDARANLVAGYNNWAVDYLRTGRYDAAVDRIEQGLFFDPAFAPLIANEQLVRIKRTGR